MIFTRNSQFYYNAALIAYFALFGLLMAWFTILVPPTKVPVAIVLLLMLTPLVLPLRGFLRGNPRSCTWISYISLIYFIHGVVESYANVAERWYAVTETILALILFFGTIYYVRFRNKD